MALAEPDARHLRFTGRDRADWLYLLIGEAGEFQ